MEWVFWGPFYAGALLAMLLGWWYRRSNRRAAGHVSRHESFVSLGNAAGATSSIDAPDLSELRVGGRKLVLSTSHSGKQGPAFLWLGTDLSETPRGAGRTGIRPVKTLPHAVVRTETQWDRLGKRLGLNLEPQTNNPRFDESAYIEAADPKDILAILRTPGVAPIAQEIVERSDASLVFNAEGYAVALRWNREGIPMDLTYMQWAIAALQRLAEAMPPIERIDLEGRRSRMLDSVLVIGAVLALVVGFVAANFITSEYKPTAEGFSKVAWMVATGGVLATWLVGYLALRGRPRGLPQFAVLVIVAFMFAPATSILGFLIVNAAPDDSTYEARTNVVSHRTQTGRRRSKTHYVTFAPWEGHTRPVERKVSSGEYAQLTGGRPVILTLGKGKLGYEWLRDARPAP